MRMKRLVVALTLVLMVLSLAGPALVSARQISKSPPVKTMKVSTQRDRGGVPGTTLSAVKTAEGYWERRYDWTLDKTADVDELTLAPNESGTVTFTITATRSEPIDVYGVRGQICVTNGGSKPTENLTITDVVEYKVGSGKFQTLVSQPVDTSAKPVLGPGETFCYPYDVQFTPVEGAQYRNVAKVKITNHSGSINDNAKNCKPGSRAVRSRRRASGSHRCRTRSTRPRRSTMNSLVQPASPVRRAGRGRRRSLGARSRPS